MTPWDDQTQRKEAESVIKSHLTSPRSVPRLLAIVQYFPQAMGLGELEEYRWKGHCAGIRNMVLACYKKFVRIWREVRDWPEFSVIAS